MSYKSKLRGGVVNRKIVLMMVLIMLLLFGAMAYVMIDSAPVFAWQGTNTLIFDTKTSNSVIVRWDLYLPTPPAETVFEYRVVVWDTVEETVREFNVYQGIVQNEATTVDSDCLIPDMIDGRLYQITVLPMTELGECFFWDGPAGVTEVYEDNQAYLFEAGAEIIPEPEVVGDYVYVIMSQEQTERMISNSDWQLISLAFVAGLFCVSIFVSCLKVRL